MTKNMNCLTESLTPGHKSPNHKKSPRKAISTANKTVEDKLSEIFLQNQPLRDGESTRISAENSAVKLSQNETRLLID